MAMSGNQKTGQGGHAVTKKKYVGSAFAGRAEAAPETSAVKPRWLRITRRP